MFSSPTFPHSFFSHSIACKGLFSTNKMGMSVWFGLLVPLFILMVLIGNQRRSDEEDEEVGSGTYQGELGEEEEDEDNDSGDADGKKTEDN